MRIYTLISMFSLTLLATTLSVSVSALPSAPPPGGYTGGVFAHYFQNIIEGNSLVGWTTHNGVCATAGQAITGYSMLADGTYGLPICGTVASPQYWKSVDAGVTDIYFTGAGNVGIGTATPGAKFDVVGGDAVINGVTVGRGGGDLSQNTTIGASALGINTTGNNNTANGAYALTANTTGGANTANGAYALTANTTGNSNTANGRQSLTSNTTGWGNTANGMQSLTSNTTGWFNTANGVAALYSNIDGWFNTANGQGALYYNTTGYFNTANGFSALTANTTGGGNTANGTYALAANTTGGSNTANGNQSLYNNTTGGFNTANGVQALYNNITGVNNTAIGYYAGANLTSGDNNIAIGANTNFLSTTASNQLNIGNLIYGSAGNIGIGNSNPTTKLQVTGGTVQIDGPAVPMIFNETDEGIVAGKYWRTVLDGRIMRFDSDQSGTGGFVPYITSLAMTAVGNVGIGTTTPGAKLEVAGTVKITGGVPGAGKVLTSDATGLASWATPSGGVTGGQTNYMARWITASNLGTGSVFDNGTNVGIGTVTPAGKLDVAGKIVAGVTTTDYLPTGNSWNYNLQLNGLDTSSIGFHDAGNNVGSIRFRNNLFTIGADDGWGVANTYLPGNVGIGTATPTAKLAVNAIGVIGLANNAAYDIGAGRIAVGQSLYSYGSICAGAASGDCTGGGGFLANSAGTVTANGTVTVGTTSSRLYMNDTDESTGGPKSLHANSNIIGFLNGAGSWLQYTNDAGQIWTPNYGWLHDGFRRFNVWQNSHYSGTDGAEYATIFYDANNSGYHADPASISQFNRIDFDHMYDRNNYGYYLDLNNASVFNVIYAAQFLYNSDSRLKQNILPITDSLTKVTALNGYTFDWKKDGKHDIGVIAQEVEKVFPDIVHTDEKTGMKSVEYGNLIAPVIEAIKELAGNVKNNTTEIDGLQSENAALRARLDAIEARLAK